MYCIISYAMPYMSISTSIRLYYAPVSYTSVPWYSVLRLPGMTRKQCLNPLGQSV